MSDICICSSYIYVDIRLEKRLWHDSLPLNHTFRDNEFCGR